MYTPVKEIDFSSKHNVLIQSEDGTYQRMDEPYRKVTQIDPNTWMILSDGDHTYLVEGENEALVIDSGYGAGNIREFCQTLTKKPVRRIANTHFHFDHTANNGYFDCAYMNAFTYEKRTTPFPSFAGIDFPRDYPVQIIDEGYLFHLGGRDLETFSFSNHTPASLAWLDRSHRILFIGDELSPAVYVCRYTAEHGYKMVEKMMKMRLDYDTLCGGPGTFSADLVDRYYEAFRYLLSGHAEEGVPLQEDAETVYDTYAEKTHDGMPVYLRQQARPSDLPKATDPDRKYKRTLEHNGVKIMYMVNRIYDDEQDGE